MSVLYWLGFLLHIRRNRIATSHDFEEVILMSVVTVLIYSLTISALAPPLCNLSMTVILTKVICSLNEFWSAFPWWQRMLSIFNVFFFGYFYFFWELSVCWAIYYHMISDFFGFKFFEFFIQIFEYYLFQILWHIIDRITPVHQMP